MTTGVNNTAIAISKPDRKFVRQVKAAGGDSVDKCFQCATCSVVCNLSPEDCPFPRKEMLWAQWGMKDKLMTDPDIWLCYQCNDCSINCPRDSKPSEVLAAIRSVAFRHFAFPGYMGTLLTKPSGLIPLLLLPIIILCAIVWQTTGGDFAPLFQASAVVDFDYFLPHGPTEMLFIIGSIHIAVFMSIGLLRFWKGMQNSWGGAVKIGFISALISTVIEIFSHSRFSSCGSARYRQIAHLLVFYGFILTAAATAMATIEMVVFHNFLGFEGHYPPFPLYHPIKICGNLGGFAIVIGVIIVMYQRITNPKNAGKAGYTMWLFIWVTGIVALSGLLCQFMRIAGIGELAYPLYFIHITTVFFLLLYSPYSQFGHMFYRTLAMVFAKSIGREAKTL
ncbi:MAG: quinone-interacting membrane-bound oxidoreductase complex subunit QmoC [Candidatus Hatepunaea meridiana]|nr:quinone-interacting membrane-bound oxidoreductase complex subunit QmoC [Candidatus Hatepunaea meridiana]